MVKPRHVAPLIVLAMAFGCARKQSEPPMQPASYEPPPNTTAEPKGLPPGTPPDQSPTSPDTPEGAGTLQKEAPRAAPPFAGGPHGGMGGIGGTGGMGPVAGRPGVGGTSSIRSGERR